MEFILCLSKLFGDLIYPPNNHTISHTHIMFEWEAENKNDEYTFELSSSSNFTTILFDKTISDTTILIQNNINWGSNYYWRVKPVNENYINIFNFSINNPSYQFTDEISPVEIITNNLELSGLPTPAFIIAKSPNCGF